MNPSRIVLRWLLLSLILVLAYTAQASFTLMGAELTYRHIDSNRYVVYLKVYRDCNGGPVQDLAIQAKSASSQFTDSSLHLIHTKDITGIPVNCPVQSKCQGTFPYGIEEQLWIDTFDLSGTSSCEWIISFKHCCRSGAIATGMANQPLYIQNFVNTCLQSQNSSPQLLSDPSTMMLMCKNQDLIYSINAVDSIDQADSIAYRFQSAMQDSGVNCSYNGPFAPFCPVTFFGFPHYNLPQPAGISFDAVAGHVGFRPTVTNQVGVIVLEVLEYRKINGVMTLISSTVRDIQYRVIDCPNNNLPRINPPFSGVVCIGKQLCFTITTDDNDPDDTVRIKIEHHLKNLAITYGPDTIKHAWAQVCWTPTSDDLNAYQHTFMVTASDNACSLPGRASRTFIMFPRDNRPQGVLNAEVLSCRELALSHQANSSYPNYSFRYRVFNMQDSLRFESFKWQDTALLDTGWYRVELLQTASGMCENLIYDTVHIAPNDNRNNVLLKEYCSADSILLNMGGGIVNALDSLHWSQLDGSTLLDLGWRSKDLKLVGRANQTFIVSADLGLCQMQDTVNIHINPLPQARFVLADDTLCFYRDTLFISDSSKMTEGIIQAWSWNGNTYSTSDSFYSQVMLKGAWNTTSLNVLSDKGCESAYSDSVYVDGPMGNPIVADQLAISEGDPALFEVVSAESISAYRWERKGWQGTHFIPVINGIDIYGMDAAKLDLLQVQAADSGSVFRCIITRHGCLDTTNEAVLQVLKSTLGLYAMDSELGIKLYPNPASSVLHVLATFNLDFEILDQLGKVVLNGKTQDLEAHVNIENLSPGVYFFRSTSNPSKMLMFSKN
ncbi:MAG: T9SS type A sorting domain-containing protein [Bacteroidetes bacterium]|nr:MAG: T9SS type A sorting domain-containing protein [Bacteroidota bacterium]